MANVIAIELNDSGIIASDGAQILLSSPGYVIDLAHQEWIGEDARLRAFLHPNECNNQFWTQLNQPQAQVAARSNASLAMRHLAFIWNQLPSNIESVILTVPANFTKAGLGLLLGICTELSIPVKAMVHHAVLSPKQAHHIGPTVHVEMQLHQTSISYLHTLDNEFGVEKQELINDVGILSVYSKAATHIVQSFIIETRLDPLHSAETEQQLYDRLPTWLQLAQQQNSIECSLEYQNISYKTTIDAGELRAICTSNIDVILKKLVGLEQVESSTIVCISNSIDVQFGFSQQAASRGLMTRTLDHGYHAQQSLQFTDNLLNDDQQVYLTKQLPYRILTDPLPLAGIAANTIVEKPTHILFRNRAYSIESELYIVQSTDPDIDIQFQTNPTHSARVLAALRKSSSELTLETTNTIEVTLNDQQISNNTQPAIGDHLRLSGCDDPLIFIKMEHHVA